MHIEHHLPLVEEILSPFKGVIGNDFTGYRNHVYRVIHLCFAQGPLDEMQREKIQIAACFHDIGLWTARTLDYLAPSEADAERYLLARGKREWVGEIVEMIEGHHALRSRQDSLFALVERFRRADIADFSLGMVPMGLPAPLLSALKTAFPNAGFHRRLLQLGMAWCVRHPFNPLPMFRR